MTDEEQKQCNKIWKENDYNRSKVLLKVVEICGNVDSPQSRYIKAIAWSFNSVIYARERIDAINDYLSKDLYEKAFHHNSWMSETEIEESRNSHIAMMTKYLADGYYSIKDYDNAEKTYMKIASMPVFIPNGYLLLADFYAKTKRLDDAINLLKASRKSTKYNQNKDFQDLIERDLLIYEKRKQGIYKHKCYGFHTYQTSYFDDMVHPELDKASENLRNKYREYFEKHIENLEKLDFYKCRIRNNEEIELSKSKYEKYCLSDIEIYPYLKEYYDEYNKLGYPIKVEYNDNGIEKYRVPRLLIVFYEKEKKYKEAIDICKKAIDYGIIDYNDKTSMEDKITRLSNKIKD